MLQRTPCQPFTSACTPVSERIHNVGALTTKRRAPALRALAARSWPGGTEEGRYRKDRERTIAAHPGFRSGPPHAHAVLLPDEPRKGSPPQAPPHTHGRSFFPATVVWGQGKQQKIQPRQAWTNKTSPATWVTGPRLMRPAPTRERTACSQASTSRRRCGTRLQLRPDKRGGGCCQATNPEGSVTHRVSHFIANTPA